MCGSHQDSSSDLDPCKTQSARSVFPLRSESPALLLVSVFSFSFFRVSANDKLRARSFSSSFTFSLKLSAASFLRLSLLTQEPRLELLPIEVIIIHHPIFSFALSLATSTCSTAPNRADLPWNSQSESKKCYVRSPCLFLLHSYLLWRFPRRRRQHSLKPASPLTSVPHGPQPEILIAMACLISQLPKKIPTPSPFSKIAATTLTPALIPRQSAPPGSWKPPTLTTMASSILQCPVPASPWSPFSPALAMAP